MASGYWSPLAIAMADGPTLIAAASATCLPVTAKFTFPPNAFAIGSMLRIHASGRISCAATTPGTSRFDVRLGGTQIFDTGPMNLNIVAKVTLPWWLDIRITCRAIGATSNFMGMGNFQSEAVIGSPLATVGGNGSILSAVAAGPEVAPVVGNSVDTTVANAFDFFFTQTVGTGSMTVHQFVMESGAIALT